jgi:chromosome segregation ATPase
MESLSEQVERLERENAELRAKVRSSSSVSEDHGRDREDDGDRVDLLKKTIKKLRKRIDAKNAFIVKLRDEREAIRQKLEDADNEGMKLYSKAKDFADTMSEMAETAREIYNLSDELTDITNDYEDFSEDSDLEDDTDGDDDEESSEEDDNPFPARVASNVTLKVNGEVIDALTYAISESMAKQMKEINDATLKMFVDEGK